MVYFLLNMHLETQSVYLFCKFYVMFFHYFNGSSNIAEYVTRYRPICQIPGIHNYPYDTHASPVMTLT